MVQTHLHMISYRMYRSMVPSLLAIKLFGFLWSVETYVKDYVLKLLLAGVHIKTA